MTPNWWPPPEAWARLDDDERAELEQRLYKMLGLRLRYSPIWPTSKQAAFLSERMNRQKEVFYGGAGGGGKSNALLMAALQYVDVPRYAAIIFRRTYSDLALPGALMDVARRWLAGTDARWSQQEHTWHFPSGGSLTFAYLEHVGDEQRYKSAEFQCIAFDEVTDFSEAQYRFLFSRLRQPEHGYYGASSDGLTIGDVPLRMRSASNPGGKGHAWVKTRFVSEETRSGVFLPAMLEDNPHLDQAGYDDSLSNLSPVLRAQIRRGDWGVRAEGSLFKREYFRVVDEVPPGAMGWVRSWDCAATEPGDGDDPDYTCGLLAAALPNGEMIITDLARDRLDPLGVRQLQTSVAAADGREVKVREEMEPGSSGKSLIDMKRRSIFRGYSYDGIRPSGSKYVRAEPVATDAAAGLILLLRGRWNHDFLDEVPAFTGEYTGHDDIVDTLSQAHAVLYPMKQMAGKKRLSSPAGLTVRAPTRVGVR